MKKFVSIALALILVLSLCGMSFAAPVRADDESTKAQLDLIYSNLASVKQNDSSGVWSYTVTDLDHNGQLEILAAMKDSNRNTFISAWEVNEEKTALVPCNLSVPQSQTFPYILAENADTYYDSTSDTWAYMFYDNMVLNENAVYTFKYSVTFKDGIMSFAQLATQCTSTVSGGYQQTSYLDANGTPITPEQYNAAGVNAFINAARSSTNFDWFGYAAASAERLADSYAVFKGVKQPDKTVPVVAYTPAPQPASAPAYLSVTKNPTNESHYSGETAYFVSNATTWTSLSWTFVSSYGGEYSVDGFRSSFPYSSVGGASSTTLTISNVTREMSGWGVYCTFYYNGQTARTNTAYLYVNEKSYNSYNQQSQKSQQNPDTITCPNCGRRNVSIYSNCPNCGYDIHTYVFGTLPQYYSGYYGNITQYSTGTVEFNNPDGSTTYSYADGSFTHVEADGTVTDFDEYGNYSTTFTDGSTYTQYSTGTTEYVDTDGTSYYTFGDGSGSIVYDDGSSIDYDSDGSFTIYDTYGDVVGGGMDYDYPEVYSYEDGWGSYGW